MKDIDEIRRDNMKALEREAGGPSDAARGAGMRTAGQWINLRNGAPDSKTGKPRGMNKATARKIERAFGKPYLWLDTDHGPADAGAQLLDSTSPSVRDALDVVLNAVTSSGDRAELRQLLPMFVETGAQAYRDRLHELLDPLGASDTARRVLSARLHVETKDITQKGKVTDAGSHN